MNLKSLAKHIQTHYDLRHDELTVVFPNKRAALYLRLEFKQIYEGTIWMPQMLSIEEAMSQWSGIKLADNIDLLFELIAINSQLGHHGDSLTTFGSMAAQMAKDFDEIDQYAVDAEHLFSYVYEEKKIGTWQLGEKITPKEQAYLDFFKQLKDYYDLLRQQLSTQGKGYYGMITRSLAEEDGETLRKQTGNQHILFVGFNALTPTEQTIIDKLYKNRQAQILWDFDRYYVDDPQNEAGFFARQYIDKDLPWKPTEFSDELLITQKEIHLVGVTGNTIQAKALQSLLETEGQPSETVILADENLMIPVLNSIPDDERYPHINVSMGYPMRHTALNNLINEFFTLHRKGRKISNKGWYLWPILRILDLEVVKVIFNKEELVQIMDYQTKIKDGSLFIYDEATFNSSCTSPDLQQFMKVLLGSDSTPTTASLLDSMIDLLRFVSYKIQSSNESITFLLNQVSETGKAVNRLKNILARHQSYVRSLDELEILFRLINSNLSIKLNSSVTDGLQLMGILETRNLDFDSFFMIGVNEGILPAEKSNSSFIPYPIRKECGLPDFREKQAVYAYHFYRLLQHARKAYFIFNNNNSDNGGEASRFLLQIQYELVQRNPEIKLFHESFVNKTTVQNNPTALSAEKRLSDLRELAPTSISAYISCPIKYFLKYIMKIKDNRLEEKTKENEIGTVIHNTLERLYDPYLNADINEELFTQRIQPTIKSILETVIRKNYGQGLSDVGFNYLNMMSINSMLENYLKFEGQWVKNHRLTVTNAEFELRSEIQAGGQTFVLKGTADRIDHCDGIIRIIDYKTGTVHDQDVKVPKDLTSLKDLPEKAVQLLIYKYLYLRQHPTTPPDTVSAAIFGLRYQQVVFELKVEDDALNAHFMETMDGLLTDLFEEMINTDVPYRQTEDLKNKPCRYCEYKTLCVNTAKGPLQEDDR